MLPNIEKLKDEIIDDIRKFEGYDKLEQEELLQSIKVTKDSNCENKEMTLEEAMYNPDNSSREAYIFYNNNYEVEKIIFYGGIVNYE